MAEVEIEGMSEEGVYEVLCDVLGDMKNARPNDRSAKDRYTAIAITDLEKLIAIYKMYVVEGTV